MAGFSTQGAIQGGMTGAMFGPWGAGIGAVAGGFLLDQDKKYKPVTQIVMTPLGERLQSSIYESIKKLYPENLMDQLIGNALKVIRSAQKTRRQFLASPSRAEGLRTGAGLAGLSAEGGLRMAEAPTRYANRYGMERAGLMGQLQDMTRYIQLQSNAPILAAQNQLFKDELSQLKRAEKGASLGSMAQLMALSKIMKA